MEDHRLPVLVRVVCAAEPDVKTPHDGDWVVEWNPHTEWGVLGLSSTRERSKAKRFAHHADVFRQWKTTSIIQPVRPDGRPNRPLTAVSIEIEPE
jgi:hypothetical protein